MELDYISLNGDITGWGGNGPKPEMLAGADFLYQKMHVLGYRALQREAHIQLAELSCRAMYGCGSGLTQEGLDAEISALLAANRYPRGSVEVMLCLFPPVGGADTAERLMFCTKQLLYDGYVMWHDTLKAVAVPYEVPFAAHRTAASLSSHSLAAGIARGRGAETAIAVDSTGVVTGVGENPLFAIAGNESFTSPMTCGIPDSVERRLGIEACRKAGLTPLEQPVEAQSLKTYDELFVVTIQGIVGIGEFEGHLYPHSMAKRIARLL